jgi:hypothetical protein
MTPLGKSGDTVQLETFAETEVALLIEMVVDNGMNSDEFLQTSHAPKTKHGPFSPPKRLVEILCPVV